MSQPFDTSVIVEVVELIRTETVNEYLEQGWVLMKVGTDYYDNREQIYYSLGRPKDVPEFVSRKKEILESV